jgi:hypothetical protein
LTEASSVASASTPAEVAVPPSAVAFAQAQLSRALQRAIDAAAALQNAAMTRALPLSLADAAQLGAQLAAAVQSVTRAEPRADVQVAAATDARLAVLTQLVLHLPGAYPKTSAEPGAGTMPLGARIAAAVMPAAGSNLDVMLRVFWLLYRSLSWRDAFCVLLLLGRLCASAVLAKLAKMTGFTRRSTKARVA